MTWERWKPCSLILATISQSTAGGPLMDCAAKGKRMITAKAAFLEIFMDCLLFTCPFSIPLVLIILEEAGGFFVETENTRGER